MGALGHSITLATTIWFVATIVFTFIFGVVRAPAASLALGLSLVGAARGAFGTPELPLHPLNGVVTSAWGACYGVVLGGCVGLAVWRHPHPRSRVLLHASAAASAAVTLAATLFGRWLMVRAPHLLSLGRRGAIGSDAYYHASHHLVVAEVTTGPVPIAALSLALLLALTARRPARIGTRAVGDLDPETTTRRRTQA